MDDTVNDKDEYTMPSHNTNCFCSTIFCKLTNEDFDETCQKKLPPITMCLQVTSMPVECLMFSSFVNLYLSTNSIS